jgi:hypothetical protein
MDTEERIRPAKKKKWDKKVCKKTKGPHEYELIRETSYKWWPEHMRDLWCEYRCKHCKKLKLEITRKPRP